MDSKSAPGSYFYRGGLRLAGIYCLIVGFVYAITAFCSKPSYVGFDGIPLMLLSMPWYRINPLLFWPGLVANTVLMYLLSSAIRYVVVLGHGRMSGEALTTVLITDAAPGPHVAQCLQVAAQCVTVAGRKGVVLHHIVHVFDGGVQDALVETTA